MGRSLPLGHKPEMTYSLTWSPNYAQYLVDTMVERETKENPDPTRGVVKNDLLAWDRTLPFSKRVLYPKAALDVSTFHKFIFSKKRLQTSRSFGRGGQKRGRQNRRVEKAERVGAPTTLAPW